MNEIEMDLRAEEALIVIDVQSDFCRGGALAVPDGDAVVPVINALVKGFDTVVATQDWHPPKHKSFASSHEGKQPFATIEMPYGEQTLWPDHCVQGSPGASLHGYLNLDPCSLILRKGLNPEVDSYSAFFENDRRTTTGLAGYLKAKQITKLYMVGLATDFCVAYSAMDARKLGFEVAVIEDACRGIDLEGSLNSAWQMMRNAGVARARIDGKRIVEEKVAGAALCQVVNMQRASYDVYIGRKGKGEDGYFGNPFRIGKDGTRDEVVEKFRVWFLRRVSVDPSYRKRVLALRGKKLGCFCKPQACHGDVIAEWVNSQPVEDA